MKDNTAVQNKIIRQIESLDKKIASLSVPRLTNTYKRQQEQLARDREIERLQEQKQLLQYLEEDCLAGKLTDFTAALISGTFYNDMRCYSIRHHYYMEQKSRTGQLEYPAAGSTEAKRLCSAGIHTREMLIQAVLQYDILLQCATTAPDPKLKRIQELCFSARLHQSGDIQFTSTSLARELIALAGLNSDSRVLEPEAGIGTLADEIRTVTSHVDCIEIRGSFREILELKGYPLIGDSFPETPPNPVYDAVIMNPPFSEECVHIRHAYGFLKPGGTLASICCTRVQYSEKKTYIEFREWLEQQDACIHAPQTGGFEKTGVSFLLLTIQKPS